jgi:hypothetical protein
MKKNNPEEAARFLSNVNRLSLNGGSHRTIHPVYGTATIVESAFENNKGVRRFSVTSSKVIKNGRYTLSSLRKKLIG